MQGAAGTLKKNFAGARGKSRRVSSSPTLISNRRWPARCSACFESRRSLFLPASRILVERPIYRRFVDAMVEKHGPFGWGNGLERDTQMGPAHHWRPSCTRPRLSGESASARRSWRWVAACPLAKRFARVVFRRATIFYDVDNRARIAQEEIFGPVACVIPFDNEDAALKIANDTHYGLAAAVWSRDIFRVMRGRSGVTRRRRVGQSDAGQRDRGAVGRLQAEWFLVAS